MKARATRIHLVDVSDPIVRFHDLLARCGETVKNGELVFAYTAESPRVYQVGTCRACMYRTPGYFRRRYEYGIREAQEALQAKAEAS